MRERLRLLWSDLQTWYGRLSSRRTGPGGERRARRGGVPGVPGAVPLSSSAAATRRRTESKLHRLAEAEQLATGYAEAERARKQGRGSADRRRGGPGLELSEKGNRAGSTSPPSSPKGELPVGDGRILESDVELTSPTFSSPGWCNFLLGGAGPGRGAGRFPAHRAPDQGWDAHRLTTVAAYRLKAGP